MVAPSSESSSQWVVRSLQKMAAVSEGVCESSAKGSYGYQCPGPDGNGDPRLIHRSTTQGIIIDSTYLYKELCLYFASLTYAMWLTEWEGKPWGCNIS